MMVRKKIAKKKSKYLVGKKFFYTFAPAFDKKYVLKK
jgi:hypothetical protein